MFKKKRISMREALLLTVNAVLLVGLALWLVVDYQRGLNQRLQDKQISLRNEAAIILPAISDLQHHGIHSVQNYIDRACAQMQDAISPGHHIVVYLGQTVLQAQTHRRASPEFAKAILQASKSSNHAGSINNRAIIVGTHSNQDKSVQVYISEFTTNVLKTSHALLLSRATGFAFVGITLTAIVNLIFLRLVTQPIKKMVSTVRQIGAGEFGASPPHFWTTELDFLSTEIRQMSHALDIADQSRRQQMAKARKIQYKLMPCSEQLVAAGIHHIHMPAEDVGGDFFDMKVIDDDRIVIYMGDVTGHGVPAAMGAGMLKILFEYSNATISEPATVLQQINRRFYAVTLDGDFVTMFMGVVDRKAGRLVYASAGHEISYVLHQDGRINELDTTGLILGVDPDAHYKEAQITINAGDTIILLTDGLSEAMSPEGETLGRTAIKQTLLRNSHASPQEIGAKLVQLAKDHQGGETQFDDITITILHV